MAAVAGMLLAVLFGIAAVALRQAAHILRDEGLGRPSIVARAGAAVCIAIALLGLGTVVAYAHDPYSSWRQPDNPAVSCCNGDDCRPTRAFLHQDGRWRAWDGQAWIVVPAGRVLPTDLAGDGRSHLCERGGHVYCFSPTSPKG